VPANPAPAITTLIEEEEEEAAAATEATEAVGVLVDAIL
jgi:hypothetical protein